MLWRLYQHRTILTIFDSFDCSPIHPDQYDWSKLYPNIGDRQVEIADVGCGYGGFLVTLGELFPDKISVGFEIRVKVSDYVIDRIDALRKLHPGKYENISCLRTNAMKYLPNYFRKGQLSKMCFLYPDPHFKKAKHKWRIISTALLTEYAYCLKENVSFLFPLRLSVAYWHDFNINVCSLLLYREFCIRSPMSRTCTNGW